MASLFLLYEGRRTRTELTATRMSVAGDGLTKPNLYFLPAGENEYRVLTPAQNKEEAIWPPLILIQPFPAPVALRYRYYCRSIDRWHRIAAN